MKITIEIGGNDYTFEMNRTVYKNLLADEEYSKMQNEITKRLKDKKAVKGNTEKAVAEIQEEMLDEDISALILRNMVMEEQIFYYSLITNQPDITIEKASALLDEAIAEYGSEEVSGLTTKLIENFTQRGDEPKKKMKMRIS
jgi:hypothetical protein